MPEFVVQIRRSVAGSSEKRPGAGTSRSSGYGRGVPADPLHRAGTTQRSAKSQPTDGSRASAIEVRRSARRRRTVSAYREGDRTVVLIPARMSEAEEQRWVRVMLDKLAAQESRRTLGDAELAERARRLSEQYFEGRARPRSVRWVTNQNTRWGSCTPSDGSIRLSHRLQGMPEYVVDYVLCHELAHLLVPGHGPASGGSSRRTRGPNGPAATSRGVVAADRLPHVPGARDE